jgi:hypothetical protein
LIGESFRAASDHYFVQWMTARLHESEFGALTLAAAKNAAVEELGLDEETVKRLLIRHSAPGGDFCLVEGILTVD